MPARSRPDGHWLDTAAAAVPAVAAGWSAALLAPLAGASPGPAAMVAALLVFAGGWLLMRSVAAPQRAYPLRIFNVPLEVAELLLDQPVGEAMDELAELLLDDPLPEPRADSRVVQLFPAQSPASPEDLRRRVELHIRDRSGTVAAPVADAADSLRQALDELRQTLHQR